MVVRFRSYPSKGGWRLVVVVTKVVASPGDAKNVEAMGVFDTI